MILLTYSFPPLSSGGTPVVLNLSKYMPEAGWEVLPLTVNHQRGFALDETTLDAIPEGLRVTRVAHREPFHSRQRAEQGARTGKPGAGPLRKLSRWFLHSFVLVPDRVITWGRDVVPAGAELIRETGAGVIVSFGPHHSLHIHAEKLARKTGALFVPFFGDLWLADSYVTWPGRLNRMIEASMERRIVKRADAILVTTRGSADYFRRKYGAFCPSVHVIENGYDPERIFPAGSEPGHGDQLLITFTGNFFGMHNPEPLLKGFELFFDRNPGASVRMLFCGSFQGDSADFPGMSSLDERIRFAGQVPWQRIPGLQRESDVLLTYLESLPGAELKNSSKLSEYLRTGRTILAVAPEGDMTGYVTRFDAGYVCEPEPEAVAATLEILLDHWEKGCLKRTSAHDEIAEVFDARNVTRRFASFLDGIVGGKDIQS